MNHYIEIQLNPDDDIPIYFLRNTCFKKLHKALFNLKSNDIGVSFPNYKEKIRPEKTERFLGDTIRLHGDKSALEVLQQSNWLGNLIGYCDISEIQPIPSDVKHRKISRKQANMTAAKLRRLIKRGSISAEEAKQYKAKMFSQSLDNPYLELESSSNGHKHRRYIEFGELTEKSVKGDFDQFGLSKVATVPWF